MGKKIWLSVHPRNFGSHVTVRPPSLASVRVYTTGKITQSTGVTTRMELEGFGAKLCGHPDV